MNCNDRGNIIGIILILIIIYICYSIIYIGYKLSNDNKIYCTYDQKKNKIGDYNIDSVSIDKNNNSISCKIITYGTDFFEIQSDNATFKNKKFLFSDFVIDNNNITPNLSNYEYKPKQITTSDNVYISDINNNYMDMGTGINVNNVVFLNSIPKYFQTINLANQDNIIYTNQNHIISISKIPVNYLNLKIVNGRVKAEFNSELKNGSIINFYKINKNKIGSNQYLSEEETDPQIPLYFSDYVCITYNDNNVVYFLYVDGNNLLTGETEFNYDKRFIFKLN
jgi:hypothetical protein